MKHFCCFFAFLFLITTASAQKFKPKPQLIPEQAHETLAIGAKAPDFKLPGVDDKWYRLRDFASAKVLVIVFTCNHCPTAQAYEDRLIAFTQEYKSKGVQVVAISPNSPPALLLEECGYTDLNDDFDQMKLRARAKKFPYPYLYDGDTHRYSLAYGPVATPHAFVFDAARTLRYQGRLDSLEKPGSANAEDLRAATDALLAGRQPAVASTKTFGCSVKWAWKNEWKAKTQADWENRPVTLESLDEAGVQALVKNAGGKKLRLINVWATWCGPCVLEYPSFLDIQRMYGARDFEFISLSADRPNAKDKALELLKKMHSGVDNYIFSGANSYKLIDAVDPNWNGALPYTLLVEPDGKVVYSVQGAIDPMVLKKIIVDHPKIGRYY